MDQIEKFIRKLNKKLAHKIASALENIIQLNLKNYDVTKMKGFDDLYRIRIGKIRIIFRKSAGTGYPICIEYRGSVYKKVQN